jgi:integrase
MDTLTQARVEALTCTPDGRDTLTTFAGGVSVRCYAGSEQPGSLAHKIFWARYSLDGKKYGVKLGRCDRVSVATALKAAKAVHGDVAKGRNPLQERKAAAAKARHDESALTLGKLLERWDAIALTDKRARYRYEAQRALKRAFKDRLAQPATSLDKETVVAALDALAIADAPIMAARIMAYGRAAFAWALKREMVEANPFTGLSVAKADERDRVLEDDELGAVLREADPGETFGAIVWMLTLTGARRSEIGGMTRDEISRDVLTWTLPGARAKNGASNDMPLSEPARRIIADRIVIADAADVPNGLLFAGVSGRPFTNFHDCKQRLDKACGVTGWTLHDLRRTAATNWQGLGVRLEVTEAILNHVGMSRAGVAGIYHRHEWTNEKRVALDAWAARVMAIVEGRQAPTNVVAITRTA